MANVKKKKKVTKKRTPKAPEQVAITLHNVFPYIVATLNSLEKKVDDLNKSIVAVGVNTADILHEVEKLDG